jgi:predicted MPP superfamily phosphohydrolase
VPSRSLATAPEAPPLSSRAEKLGPQFRVRRFAGPSAHVGALSHLRVAHLTDLHVGRVTPEAVQETAVELTNRERPDVVVITGDFVCHSQLYLDQLSWLISRFDAPVLCVLGNHDYWAGASEVRHALVRGGAEVLSNRHTTLTFRGQRLQVVGLDDAYTGHASLDDAVRGLEPGVPTLGLSHIAEEAEGLWARGVPLVLSGHTHAGQVTLARLHELAIGKLAGHKYVHGLYGQRMNGGAPDAASGGAVYVGAGVGASVMPLRVGERGRRELTLFELGHEPGSFDEPLGEQAPGNGRAPSEKKRYQRAAAVLVKEHRRLRRAKQR